MDSLFLCDMFIVLLKFVMLHQHIFYRKQSIHCVYTKFNGVLLWNISSCVKAIFDWIQYYYSTHLNQLYRINVFIGI